MRQATRDTESLRQTLFPWSNEIELKMTLTGRVCQSARDAGWAPEVFARCHIDDLLCNGTEELDPFGIRECVIGLAQGHVDDVRRREWHRPALDRDGTGEPQECREPDGIDGDDTVNGLTRDLRVESCDHLRHGWEVRRHVDVLPDLSRSEARVAPREVRRHLQGSVARFRGDSRLVQH